MHPSQDSWLHSAATLRSRRMRSGMRARALHARTVCRACARRCSQARRAVGDLFPLEQLLHGRAYVVVRASSRQAVRVRLPRASRGVRRPASQTLLRPFMHNISTRAP